MEAIAKPGIQEKKTARQRLVLFDFDGTITSKDTLAQIMIHYHGNARYLLGLFILSPLILFYMLKLIPSWKTKQLMLSLFFKGQDAIVFDDKCRDFSLRIVPKLVRAKALEKIRDYQSAGATVVVVTASAENWVKPWCDQLGIACLGTKLEVVNNTITGKILGKNCHGSEKVCRVTEKFDLRNFEEIIAFGDSPGDKEMLALAHRKYYKPFRD